MSERYCSSVPGCSLRSSLCDCIEATSAFCCQSSAGCAVISSEFLRTSGLLCCRSDHVELSTEAFAWSRSHHPHLRTFTEVISLFRVLALGAIFRRWSAVQNDVLLTYSLTSTSHQPLFYLLSKRSIFFLALGSSQLLSAYKIITDAKGMLLQLLTSILIPSSQQTHSYDHVNL